MTDDQHARFIQMFLDLAQNYVACGGTVVVGIEQNSQVRPVTITGGDVMIMRNIIPALTVEVIDCASVLPMEQRLLNHN